MPALQIKAGAMSTGDFTSFVIALLMLYEPVKRLTGIHNIFQQALGASQKVFEYLDRDQQIKEKPGAARLARFEKSIVFENVSFRYPTAPERLVLDEHQPGGEGRGGGRAGGSERRGQDHAGQSGPALLRRDWRARSASTARDLRDLRLSSLRDKISIVAQDTFLFNDTVGANIGYGLRHASPEQVHQAARNALAEEFISRMPRGLRHHHRRARHEAERRPAAAPGHRARAAEERAHPDSGRGHIASGYRIGGAGAAGAAEPDGSIAP